MTLRLDTCIRKSADQCGWLVVFTFSLQFVVMVAADLYYRGMRNTTSQLVLLLLTNFPISPQFSFHSFIYFCLIRHCQPHATFVCNIPPLLALVPAITPYCVLSRRAIEFSAPYQIPNAVVCEVASTISMKSSHALALELH